MMTYYLLDIRTIRFANVTTARWYDNPSYLFRIGQIIYTLGWDKYFSYLYSPRSKTFSTFDTADKLAAYSQKQNKTFYLVHDNKHRDYDEQPIYLKFILRNDELLLRLGFRQPFIEKNDFTLNQLIKFVTKIVDNFAEDGVVGPDIQLREINTQYPRVRPPRESFSFSNYGHLIDFYSRKSLIAKHRDSQLNIEQLFVGDVPDHIENTWHNDDLRIIRWVDDWFDEQHVMKRRSIQEQWVVEQLNPPITDDYNDLGDKVVRVGKPKPDQYLTSYNMYQYGYKATVVMPDGSVDELLFANLESWIQAGHVPDGREINRLYLIVQSRAACQIIYDRAMRIGLSGVFYVGEDHKTWNPFPSGLWLT